jgi:sec-independent protein translocase protein TatB
MEILGIGPSELLFIIVIALIVLGPRDMQKTGRTIGKWLRRVVTSDGWKLFQQTSREIQTLPNRLMREAALDELREVQKDLKQPLEINRRPSEPTEPGTPQPVPPIPANPDPAAEPDNRILPPPATPTIPTSPTDSEEKNA